MRGRSRLQVQVGSLIWIVGVSLGGGFVGRRHGRSFPPLVRIGRGSGDNARIVALIEGNDGREVFDRGYLDIVDVSYIIHHPDGKKKESQNKTTYVS